MGRHVIDHIVGRLETQATILDGATPEAGVENSALVREIREVGERVGVLAVDLLGSRVQGTHVRDSDVDLAVLRTKHNGQDPRSTVLDQLRRSPAAADLEVNVHTANSFLDMQHPLPDKPEEFIRWFKHGGGNRVLGLIHEGVYDTPDRRIAGVAALAVLNHSQASGKLRTDFWSDIRGEYAKYFLGERDRVLSKLIDRSGIAAWVLLGKITEEFWDKRVKDLGLPEDLAAFYEQERAWLEQHASELEGSRWLTLYRAVEERLSTSS